MAFIPTRYDVPFLKSLHILQHAKNRRSSLNPSLFENTTKIIIPASKQRLIPINNRTLSPHKSPDNYRTTRLRLPSSRVFFRTIRSRQSEQVKVLDDSFGLRAFSLSSNNEKTVSKRPIYSSISDKKPSKTANLPIEQPKHKEAIEINLSPWQG